MVSGYGQYKDDFFNKLNPPFIAGKTLLDVGCGDGIDATILRNEYGLRVTGTDVFQHENISAFRLPFKRGSVYDLSFRAESFDYVFLHDVLHHIDEPRQRCERHKKGAAELRRVCKKGGVIVVAEGNRYNPLFYPHMVKMRGHDHFRQKYFQKLITGAFSEDEITFRYFEAHLYPARFIILFKWYEWMMEHIVPRAFIAYNAAIILRS